MNRLFALRIPTRPSILGLVTLALLGVSALAAGTASAQARPRAIVLSFEGWHANEAREAVSAALGVGYELISEAQAVEAAAQIGVDVSSPEGMAAVVQHLGIELVVGGSVAGTGRRSTTSIFVLDVNGNQIGDASAPGPSGQSAAVQIGAAAVGACGQAMSRLHPPPPQPEQQPEQVWQPEPEPAPPPRRDEPPMHSLEDIENERPGGARGGGGSGYGGWSSRSGDSSESGGGDGSSEERWVQPVFRGLLALDIRNRNAYVLTVDEGAPVPASAADFYPQMGLDLELRPVTVDGHALYARLASWFSAGMRYYPYNEDESRSLQVFGIEALVGYAGTFADRVELIAALGFGYDSYALELANRIHETDFPSVAYPYLPITVGGRVRLLPSSIQGADLHLELMVGPRIIFGGGQIAGRGDSTDPETAAYFAARSGADCPGRVACNGDFGGVSGAAIDLRAGLGLIIDPGFSAALRFQYVNYFLGFADGTGTREAYAGNDESIHIQILLGWSVR